MKNVLFATCAAIVVATSAWGASAGQFAAPASSGSDALVRVDDHGYYDGGYYGGGDNSWQYQYQDSGYNNDWHHRGWSEGDYGNQAMVSPRWIGHNLQQSDYRSISRPVLSGKFYQVKALNPNGHKVKLYIDAYTGRIVKVKG